MVYLFKIWKKNSDIKNDNASIIPIGVINKRYERVNPLTKNKMSF